jgi:carboxyl-terminal processing protease
MVSVSYIGGGCLFLIASCCYTSNFSNAFPLSTPSRQEAYSIRHRNQYQSQLQMLNDHSENRIVNDKFNLFQEHKSDRIIQQQNKNVRNGATANILSMIAFAFATTLLVTPISTLPSHAAGYESLSPEQKFVAETWRTVDSTFLDRTFNGQDWFQIRQDLVKKKYKNFEEAQMAVSDMMSELGDKYTKVRYGSYYHWIFCCRRILKLILFVFVCSDQYLSPAKYQSLVDSATGTLAGIGVEIATNKDALAIVSDVEPNSPAQKAGLLPNDIFLESDGVKFDKTSTPDDVALKLRGPQGSRVGVTVLRNGETKDFIIQREPIKVTSVRAYIKNKVGVIRIKNFSATTSATVKETFEDLKKKGAKTILFDLRSNPGGLLPGGTETASLFLKANQPLVFVVSNKGVVDSQETFTDGFDTETPVVVLVDHNTASAAEVFTAALQENGRAKVVGEQVC